MDHRHELKSPRLLDLPRKKAATFNAERMEYVTFPASNKDQGFLGNAIACVVAVTRIYKHNPRLQEERV